MTRTRILTVSSLVIALAVLLGASAVLANGHARPGAAAGRAAVGGAGRTAAAGPPVSTRRFTLEFVDAELVDVFQALATQSGANIAVSGSVKGKTTLRLRNVTLEQAMNIVTKLNGLDYAWVDVSYVVGTPEEVRAMRVSELRTQAIVLQHIKPEYAQEVLTKIAPEVTVSAQKGSRTILLLGTEASLAKAQRALAEMDVAPLPEAPTTEVVPIRYLKAEEVADMIASAMPEVAVQPGTRPNSLLITADSMQWEAVRSMLASVDVPPAPAQATQAVYYVKYTSPSELQDTLTSLVPDVKVMLAPRSFTPSVQKPGGSTSGATQLLAAPQYGGTSGGGGGGGGAGAQGGYGMGAAAETAGAPVTALILTGAPWTVERALQILQQLDIAPRQVHIAAMITEVNRDEVAALGVDWDLGKNAGIPFGIGEAALKAPPAGGPGILGLPARGLQVGKIQRTALQWSAIIRALETKHHARILSNPSVTTLDGRQTVLHTGDTIYYQTASAASSAVVLTTTERVDTGILLLVNPRISGNNEVTLTISPSVSTAVLGNTGLPVVSEKALVTTVRVRSGETVVLAGLIRDQDDVVVKKVPFLGDIPIVGELFRHRERNPVHQEVLILVTPTIVEG